MDDRLADGLASALSRVVLAGQSRFLPQEEQWLAKAPRRPTRPNSLSRPIQSYLSSY